MKKLSDHTVILILWNVWKILLIGSLLLHIPGCANAYGNETYWQHDEPVRSMTRPSNTVAKDTFRDRVMWDVDVWRSVLPAGCPMPFHFDQEDPSARNVWLVPKDEWQVEGAIGVFESDDPWDPGSPNSSISILALPDGTLGEYSYDPTWIVAQHELGHALGLGHSDPAYGPSLMATTGGPMEPRDIAAAACALNCGPCGPDPYDLP